MKSLKFKNGDIAIESKHTSIATDIQQKIQKTEGMLQIVEGELFYNTELGLDYKRVLDVERKNISKEQIKIAIMDAVLKDDNVENIDFVDFQYNLEERKLNIEIKLKYKKHDGIITLGGVIVE